MTRVIGVANTWADHFRISPEERAGFIEHYVSRAQEHRFWCAKYNGVTFCRLGTVLLSYDGKRISEHNIAYTIFYKDSYYKYRGKQTRRGLKVPAWLPTQKELANLKRAVSRAGKVETNFAKMQLGMLSTFSKSYRELAATEVKMDVGRQFLGFEKNSDCRYTNPRMRWYMGLGAYTLKQFCAELPADVLKVIRSIHCPSIPLFNWIMEGNVAHRIQAVKAYPLLLPCALLIYPDEDKDTREGSESSEYYARLNLIRGELACLIDKGESVRPLLAGLYNCSESAVKSIGKYKVRHTGSIQKRFSSDGRHAICDYILADLIAATKLGNRQPDSKKAWINWRRFYYRGMDYYSRCGHGMGLASFLAGMPPWDSDSWDTLDSEIRNLGDLTINNFQDDVWQQDEERPYVNFNMWPAKKLKELLAISDKWHKERADKLREFTDQAIAEKKDKTIWSWRPMLNCAWVHEDTQVDIVELDNPQLLVNEAIELDHCVDSYSMYCFDGRSRIVSFRKNGKAIATAEFCLKQTKNNYTPDSVYCRQLSGWDNDVIPPSSPAGLAYAWFLKQIHGRTIPVNLEWPCVPFERRPGGETGVDRRLREHMKHWLRTELGI